MCLDYVGDNLSIKFLNEEHQRINTENQINNDTKQNSRRNVGSEIKGKKIFFTIIQTKIQKIKLFYQNILFFYLLN